MPERILYSLYCTLILPYINYGILVWGCACKTYLEKLHKLQKWAVRAMSNSHYRSHSKPLFNKYGILNVYDAYKLEVGIFMYKYHTESLPKSFDDFFIKRSDFHKYYTRYSSDYHHTRNKKVFTDQAIRTAGPILWNSLNDLLKNVRSVRHFRKKFKATLISSYNSRAAKHIHCAQNVKTVRLCTEFNKSISNIFMICHILWHFQDGRH